MKVGGVENDKGAALTEPYVVRRGTLPNGEPRLLAFIAQPVWSLDDFRERCPIPEIPPSCVVYKPDGRKVSNPNDPQYVLLLEEHNRKQWGYTILKSLEPSRIEFDGVSLDDPDTWGNVELELRGELGHFEFGRVMTLIDEANNIDLDMLEENRQTFFQQNSSASTDVTPPDDRSSTS